MTEERKYTITIHTSETKEVTKDQYVSHIEQKMRYRYDELMSSMAKSIKAIHTLKEDEKKFELVGLELKQLVGEESFGKYQEYIRWAYAEQNPKKAELLKGKV